MNRFRPTLLALLLLVGATAAACSDDTKTPKNNNTILDKNSDKRQPNPSGINQGGSTGSGNGATGSNNDSEKAGP